MKRMERKLKVENNDNQIRISDTETRINAIDERLTVCEARNLDAVKSQDMIVGVFEKDIKYLHKTIREHTDLIDKLKGDSSMSTYLFYTLPSIVALFCCIIILVYFILWFK